MPTTNLPGYSYGDRDLPTSPVTLAELDHLEATVLWSEDDEAALRTAGEVLAGRTEEVLDVWYGFVASHPHLLAHFADPTGQPIEAYLGRVRERFGQWILDTCTRPHDQAWLDQQHELARRHHTHKNATDDVDSTPLIPARYLIAFIHPLTATMRPFLAAEGHSDDEVDAMHAAWCKAVTLTAALWCQPHAADAW